MNPVRSGYWLLGLNDPDILHSVPLTMNSLVVCEPVPVIVVTGCQLAALAGAVKETKNKNIIVSAIANPIFCFRIVFSPFWLLIFLFVLKIKLSIAFECVYF